MDLEKYYSKLPEFIKYNPSILNLFLFIGRKIRNLNVKSKQIESQQQLLSLLFINCDINAKGNLRQVQLLYVEFLRFFDNVCSKYNLKYWLDYGTLLGAVRHGGFILWDDDVDLAMLRSDYEKLIEILPKELSNFQGLKEICGLTLPINSHENYFKDFKDYTYFKDYENFPLTSRFFFLEFCILEPYIKIDVFPKDFLLDNKIDLFEKKYLSTKYKFNKEVKNDKKDFFKELKEKSCELGLVNYKTRYFTNTLDDLELMPPHIFKTEDVFPLNKIKFEGCEFNCPNNFDNYLKVLYGDNYMKLPKIIEHHDMIEFICSQFSSNQELVNRIDYLINYFKKINDNFEM